MEKEVLYYTILDKNKMVEVLKENIHTIRLLRNCTIKKFAKICNVCPQTVSN